jgi:hypothetical protein
MIKIPNILTLKLQLPDKPPVYPSKVINNRLEGERPVRTNTKRCIVSVLGTPEDR